MGGLFIVHRFSGHGFLRALYSQGQFILKATRSHRSKPMCYYFHNVFGQEGLALTLTRGGFSVLDTTQSESFLSGNEVKLASE